jgi:hypothetical protein
MRAEFPSPSAGSHTKLKKQMDDFLDPDVKMSEGGTLASHGNTYET